MADSANGKLEEAQKLEEVQVEAVRDIAIDDYSVEHPKKTQELIEAAEESPVVEEAALVVEEQEEEVPISVAVTEAYVVDDVKPEEKGEKVKQYAPPVDETDESSSVVEDVVSKSVEEEKTISELVSNGAEELALPYLSEEKTISDAVSNEAEELALPYLSKEIANVVSNGSEDTKEPCLEVVAPAVEDVVSKGIEEVNLPIVEEISTGESSDAAYKVTSESAVDESSKPSPVVPVPTPVESTEAGEGYGKREMPEGVGNPSIVSVTRSPLQPTSWRSCCGLFEVLRRSDK